MFIVVIFNERLSIWLSKFDCYLHAENSSKPQYSTVNGVFPSSNGTYLANKNIKHSKGVSDLYLGWDLSPSYRHFVNIIYNLKVQ